MNLVQRALQIAHSAHKGQTRWGGTPYIIHPIRVACNHNILTEDECIVALLHDVVEDNPYWTFERLLFEGFDSHIVRSIESVTRLDTTELYRDLIERAAKDPIGKKVKLADLEDNYSTTKPENKLKYSMAMERLKSCR